METPSHPPTGHCRGVWLRFTVTAFYNGDAEAGRPLGPLTAHCFVPGHPLSHPEESPCSF